MELITVTEVQEVANERNIDLTGYSDERLEDLISIAQADLEAQTGRRFTADTVTETILQQSGQVIPLKHYPLDPDTLTLTLDGDATTDYTIDQDHGIIYLSSKPFSDYTVVAVYTLTNPRDIALARQVCIDLTLQLVTDDGEKEIRSYSDGDLSITYTDKSTTEKRIERLRRTGGVTVI